MAKVKFIRLAEVINKKQDKRVMSVSIKPTLYDCTGMIWFTDIQLQEGPVLNGYATHTESRLEKLKVDGSIKNPVWFNGVVRSAETIILFNVGETSAGLDIHIYPKLSMSSGTVKLSQGIGGQPISFPREIEKDVDLALLASTRVCTKNCLCQVKSTPLLPLKKGPQNCQKELLSIARNFSVCFKIFIFYHFLLTIPVSS